jgi:hypothetical protein
MVYVLGGASMTILATDDFNRADAGTLGANWTDLAGETGWSIVSSEAKVTSAGSVTMASRWTAVSFPNNQWAQVAVGSTLETTSDQGVGPMVRAQSGGDRILMQGNSVQTRVYKKVSGTFTQLGTDGPAVTNGDVLYLEIQGTTVVAKLNGTSVCGSPIALGTGPSTGSAGLWAAPVSVLDTGNNWSGGDFNIGLPNKGAIFSKFKTSHRPRPFGPGNAR